METDTDGDFIAYCHLENTHGLQWVIDKCPICGESHKHGAGFDPFGTLSYLGHRLQHCTYEGTHGFDGYMLVEDPNMKDKRLEIEKEYTNSEDTEEEQK